MFEKSENVNHFVVALPICNGKYGALLLFGVSWVTSKSLRRLDGGLADWKPSMWLFVVVSFLGTLYYENTQISRNQSLMAREKVYKAKRKVISWAHIHRDVSLH